MNVHKNAPLTPKGREAMVRSVVEGGLSQADAAHQFNTTPKTVAKWIRRFRGEGVEGLRDRSSRPHSSPSQTPPATCAAVEALRRQRHTGKQIAAKVKVSPATVSRILRRLGLSRIRDLEPVEPVRRYERGRPGELIHIDIKKLGRFVRPGHRITGDRQKGESRGAGHEFVHVAIDDTSRLAFTQIRRDQRKESAIAFLTDAVASYRSLGMKVTGIMTDNGSCYRAKAFRRACGKLGLKHIFTRPYRPQTNGKAERFIQTALREWAYARAYDTSDQRAKDLPIWLHHYNWHRPHGSLKSKPPISRLALHEDDLLRFHS
ncbi:IS481 family transposase [Bradyrhizobium sp. CCGUVB1N3]|uniref:IS481 family transposase n=1 Tax=Bradyrhizobium sp. CCGUVB1N3 TaxID=2949629 RepID=UPI0020B31093|nr:IS481 family transposase [Bradyrhizobium sp. CCGUVB1N3]MCP3469943.1 IS481 family transposase [Bradyrhizobium sp. CCGUVB1N3]